MGAFVDRVRNAWRALFGRSADIDVPAATASTGAVDSHSGARAIPKATQADDARSDARVVASATMITTTTTDNATQTDECEAYERQLVSRYRRSSTSSARSSASHMHNSQSMPIMRMPSQGCYESDIARFSSVVRTCASTMEYLHANAPTIRPSPMAIAFVKMVANASNASNASNAASTRWGSTARTL